MAELLREISLVGISMSACPIKPVDFVSLIKLIDSGSINGKIAKMVFVEMFSTGKGPEEIVNEKGLTQVTDTSEILNFVKQAIEANPQPVQQVKEGKATALNFLVGQVMKLSRGKANPQLAAEALKNELGTR
jgi:aspartyl-tRNA(Asn)/glutamyl-tRNA(Gln) amidotransferase subunit B